MENNNAQCVTLDINYSRIDSSWILTRNYILLFTLDLVGVLCSDGSNEKKK